MTTEAESIEDAVSRRLRSGAFPETPEWLLDLMSPDGDSFINRESDLWDFKREWPFSHSDEYYLSIIKHIIGFANAAGGLLIFGIDDDTRKIVDAKTRPNLDRLRRSLVDITSNAPTVDLRTYKIKQNKSIHVLIVYRNNPVCLPASFNSEYAQKNSLQRFWVRVGNETVVGQAKHIALLFCGSGLPSAGGAAIDASLPASPTKVRQFVGRLDTIERVFEWLHVSHEPRAFLFGRGGSGKTSIAFEFAKHLSAYGRNVRLDNGDALDGVIFMTAKERQLDTNLGKSVDFVGTDFSDEMSLYRSILVLAGNGERDPFAMEKTELIFDIQILFDSKSLLLIIDDIDTLTTKGIDAGFDTLFRLISRAKRSIKVLYTLRNAPTQSLSNSIEVLGLRPGKEYYRFIEVCCRQFGVEEPDKQYMDGKLASVTERRPLILETIIALRKHSGDYERAVQLFEENVGEDARAYVFQREWNALPGDNNARNLLGVLALYGKPLAFGDLVAMLRNEPTVILESIAATREMFLDVDEVEGASTYQLGNLTRVFVLGAARGLDKFATIEARVNSFKKSFLPEFPELSRILQRAALLANRKVRFHNDDAANEAWQELNRLSLPPKVTEDPRFRSMRGYVATLLSPPNVDHAAADFRFSMSMKYEPDIEYLQSWYRAEEQSGFGGAACDEIVEFVAKGRRYSEEDKLEFQSRRASRLYHLAVEERFINYEQCVGRLKESVKIHSQNYAKSLTRSLRNTLRYEMYFKNTMLLLAQVLINKGQCDELIEFIAQLSKVSGSILDPTTAAMAEYLPQGARGLTKQGAQKMIGRLNYLRGLISNISLWDDEHVRGSALSTIDSVCGLATAAIR